MGLFRTRIRWLTKSKSLLLLIFFLSASLYFLQTGIDKTSYQVPELSSNQTSVTKLPGNQFHQHRLRWWWMGRCVDSPDGDNLVVTWCDPDQVQSFSLTADYKLIYDRTAKCVGYNSLKQDSPLLLFNCDAKELEDIYLFQFDILNSSYLIPKLSNKSDQLCMSPISRKKYDPCLNDSVGITECDDIASRLLIIDEQFFQNDRKLLRNLVISPGDKSCDFKACGMNKLTPLIKQLAPEQITKCSEPWKCVTVVIKTARRPRLVLRLAQSIRDSYGYDLPISCFDDGPDNHSIEIQEQISQYPLLNYIVGSKENYGIAEGRNMALSLVRTKYFFLLDDDMMFLETTELRVLIDILDTTDATVAGGEMIDRQNFASLLKFGYFGGRKRKMGYFIGSCDRANRTVPNYPMCIQCDLNTNVFMARTESILSLGGWDPELKILEHKDIFIRLKAAALKVAVCRHVKVKHDPPVEGSIDLNEEYLAKRKSNQGRYAGLMRNRYNIEGIFFKFGQNVNDAGEVMFFDKVEENKLC